MKAILVDAVAVGNATARAILFASRDERTKIYPDRQYFTPFIGGSSQFADGAERLLDARPMFHYYATGITPAMAAAKPGTGSAYAANVRDSAGRYLDGSKTYSVTLPGPVPVGQFWAFTVYDSQTRRRRSSSSSADCCRGQPVSARFRAATGGATVWFGPTAPAGQEGNWVQTAPGKSWNVILRLYAPLQPWFDQSWKPGFRADRLTGESPQPFIALMLGPSSPYNAVLRNAASRVRR
jgi:hypothetical protein